MKGEDIKLNKGITLIALIITIIVLLILAIVSIRLVINEGIFSKAETAVNNYEIAQEKEQIALAYQDYQMQKVNGTKNPTLTVEEATVDGDEANGWEITFNQCRHQYTLSADGTEIEYLGAKEPDTVTTPQDFTYQANEDGENTITITGITGNANIVEIPKEIDGKTVTEIGTLSITPFNMEFFVDITSRKEEDFDDTYYAYKESIMEFDEKWNLSILKNFDQLSAKEKIAYYDDFAKYVLEYPEMLKKNANTHIQEVIIPETVTKIEDAAFAYMSNLRKVTIPASVTQIGASVFYRCFNLRDATINSNVLGNNMFCNCTHLKNVTFNGKITEIPEGTFNACYSLQKIVIPKGVTKISTRSFQECVQLKSMYLPNTLATLDNISFVNNLSWENLTIYYEGSKEEWESLVGSLSNYSSTYQKCTVYCDQQYE